MYYHEESDSWQIKVTQRASISDPWSEGSVVSGLPDNICAPSLSQDELTIVYNNPNVGNWDMYIATRPDKDSPFGNIRNLSEINTAGIDMRPFLAPDALSIYYCEENLGQIFEATRQSLNDPFSNPHHLSGLDIPGGWCDHPSISISSDGKAMYLVGGITGLGDAGNIYVSYNVPEPCMLLLFGLGAAMIRLRSPQVLRKRR
jgi:hypothetical protein